MDRKGSEVTVQQDSSFFEDIVMCKVSFPPLCHQWFVMKVNLAEKTRTRSFIELYSRYARLLE